MLKIQSKYFSRGEDLCAIIALLISLAIKIIALKLFAITIMIGLYGVWLLINGILMVAAPKSERGDVADQ